MPRFWTCHWQFRYWRPEINGEGGSVASSGSNIFRKRGVSVGDVAYVISMGSGQVYLGGRMVVKKIISREEAAQLWDSDSLYDATEWIVDPDREGTPLNLHRRLAPEVTRQLRFVSKDGAKGPFFVSESELDKQAVRGVRELTPESAALLDRIIEITDRRPEYDRLLTVTEEVLQDNSIDIADEFRLPEEISPGTVFSESGVRRVQVNRYERNRNARNACIAAHGAVCCICGFNFGIAYGPEADGYIHVHHINQLAGAGGDRVVDPAVDLCPVCPNCHAVLHMGDRCRTVEEVRELLARQKFAAI